jgi:hypothetical protein
MQIKISISPVTWAIILSSLVIGIYSYWFYTNFEKVIFEKDIGPTKEAKANPFFAAEKFLTALDKSVETHKTFAILDKKLKAYDILIIESSRVGLSDSKREQINQWVESGGHLILLATEVYDDEKGTSRDVFLDELGIRLYENYNYSWDDDEQEHIARFTLGDSGEPTKVEFNLEYYLQDDGGKASFVEGNDYSDLFAQYLWGLGTISVVTDMNIWKNSYIDDLDHAMFLYQLVDDGENISFLYQAVQPSLLSLMFERIPMIVISFLAFVCIFLFSYSWRKGSPQSDAILSQREIMQHIEAAGEFSYRNDDGKRLLDALVSSLELRLRKSIHNYNGLKAREKLVKISQLTGIKENDLQILWNDSERTQDNFVKQVILTQNIRKHL